MAVRCTHLGPCWWLPWLVRHGARYHAAEGLPPPRSFCTVTSVKGHAPPWSSGRLCRTVRAAAGCVPLSTRFCEGVLASLGQPVLWLFGIFVSSGQEGRPCLSVRQVPELQLDHHWGASATPDSFWLPSGTPVLVSACSPREARFPWVAPGGQSELPAT